MKKTLTIATLVALIGVCILFACKKTGSKENLSTSTTRDLKANAITCNFIDLSGELSTQTLVNTNIYRLNGIVTIPSGVTVTVPAGTVFYGVKSATAPAWLVIEKGGKLIATGTSSSPIVFTSDQAPGSRAAGDWGGIAFAGNAPVNSTTLGITLKSTTPTYSLNGGGSTSADNSGTLQYVQMFFAGKGDSGDDRSRAGLILNSVGSATTIDHLQISNSLYDGFAMYGGTVKQNYLISYNAGRTDFRISYGYQANMQYLAAMRLNNSAVPPTPYLAYGLDITNDLSGSTNTPLTQPVISNITVLGPNHCSSSTVSSSFADAIHFGLNGAGKIYNSVFSSWNSSITPSGLLIDGSGSVGQTASNNLEFSYNSFDNSGATPYSSPSWTGGCSATMAAWITGTGVVGCRETGNQFSVSTLGYDSSFCSDFCGSGFSQNFVLGTTTLSSPNFTWDTGGAFSHPTYRGAFGATDFTQGWTNWCAQNSSYCI
jgi:hypothetical protein